jgi:hypothetical protein
MSAGGAPPAADALKGVGNMGESESSIARASNAERIRFGKRRPGAVI